MAEPWSTIIAVVLGVVAPAGLLVWLLCGFCGLGKRAAWEKWRREIDE